MGTEQRIGLPREGLDIASPTDPRDAGLERFATQPPMGCRYLDESSNYTNCTGSAATVLDLRSTAGNVEYDPYDLISVANNTVTIPHPGIWDVNIEIAAADIAAINDYLYVQFSQDPNGAAAEGQLADFNTAFKAGQNMRLLISGPGYNVTKSRLATFGKLYYVTVYNASMSINTVKVVSLSMWLRSAHLPSKY